MMRHVSPADRGALTQRHAEPADSRVIVSAMEDLCVPRVTTHDSMACARSGQCPAVENDPAAAQTSGERDEAGDDRLPGQPRREDYAADEAEYL